MHYWIKENERERSSNVILRDPARKALLYYSSRYLESEATKDKNSVEMRLRRVWARE